MLLKIVVGIVAVTLGALSQFEEDSDVLISSKGVAMTTSRAKVFQFLSDIRNYMRWYPRVVESEPIDFAPMSAGKHFMITYEYSLYSSQYSAMVSGYESPQYISFFVNDWLSTRVEITVERRSDSRTPTYCSYKLFSRNRSYFMKYLVGPILNVAYSGELRTALIGLRHQVLT